MNREHRPSTRVAVAWYRPEEWLRLRTVSVDASALEATYDEWLAHAEMAVQQAQRSGLEVVRIDVEIDDLVAWCEEEGLAVNGQARARYAADKGRRLP